MTWLYHRQKATNCSLCPTTSCMRKACLWYISAKSNIAVLLKPFSGSSFGVHHSSKYSSTVILFKFIVNKSPYAYTQSIRRNFYDQPTVQHWKRKLYLY